MSSNNLSTIERLKHKYGLWLDNQRLFRFGLKVANRAHPKAEQNPVIFFNASTRLVGMSLNAAFATLAAMGLQSAGVPVIYFACRAGMSRCVLGANRDHPELAPPCKACINQSKALFAHAPTVWFEYQVNPIVEQALKELNLPALHRFTFPLNGLELPLGALTLPALRWVLRRHDLADDQPTRFLFRQYILSAYHLAGELDALLAKVEPSTLVVFNGVMYPEATARFVAEQRGVRVITHEVSFAPASAFFTDGNATEYPIEIPPDFDLSAEQNGQLNEYLEQRFQGQFTMAGIRFWPEMQPLDSDLLAKIETFSQTVAIFSNVIFDTSQIAANVTFESMFDWLDTLLEVIRTHPQTLFVLRAHPDEMRPGKESRQSVGMWVAQNKLHELDNVVFIDSRQYLSSYELIRRAKFIMVYNSSIGLEATLLGVPVLCAAAARYTRYPTVFFPQPRPAYLEKLAEFLAAETIEIPPEHITNARKFLYYQLFRCSLPFGDFIEPSHKPGFVRLRSFPLEKLHPDQSPSIRTIYDGIIHHKPFYLPG